MCGFRFELSADHRRQAEQEAIEKYERDQRGIKQFEYKKGFEKGVKDGRAEGHEKRYAGCGFKYAEKWI